MLHNLFKIKIISCSFMMFLLCGCIHPPYNNFQPKQRIARGTVIGATLGTAVGAASTGTVPGALIGTAVGGALGAVVNTSPQKSLINALQRCDIQVVQYGDTMTMIIPTDKYYLLESPRFNEFRYPGLLNIVELLRHYPDKPIYVAGFTDNVGTSRHQAKLSQAQAETMLSYLWANGIKAQRLKAEGYGDKYTVADNNLIHGSAMNRRIEIQWFIGKEPQCCIRKANFAMK